LGYANNYFKGSDFKALIGLVGGVGSIGGILAGLLTRFLAERFGTNSVMWMGIIFTFIPALSFLKTKNLSRTIEDKARTPIASFDLNLKKYIGIVAAIVALSQVIINIADFNFHLVFEQTIKDSSERTSKLGDIYMYMNVVTFFLQFIVLPFVMLRTSEKNYHYFIPLSYFFFFMIVVLLFPNGLLPLSLFFIYLKASDYSLFSAGKEVLYQPLSINQKYGAKYLTDMLVYRFSKAMIALVLIYVQNSYILNIVMFICFFMWISLVSKLFNQQKLILN
jgi:AAA family ATP:ADP antiporter